MADDDRALLARVGRGDQDALTCLYAQYRPRLWRYLWERVDGDAATAEDVLQETFVSVWRTAAAFRGEATVATWIFRIAHHHAANARRTRDRDDKQSEAVLMHGHGLGVGWDGRPALQRASHDDEVLARITLEDALRRLSTKHREVVELFFSQGFRLEEVAAILGAPVGTVKSRLSYARRALRGHLSRCAAEEGSHEA